MTTPTDGLGTKSAAPTTDPPARSALPRQVAPVVAALLVALAFVAHGLSGRAFVLAGVLAALVALSVIDYEQRRLPNAIVLPAAAATLLANSALYPDHAVEWIAAALGLAAPLAVLALARPGALGMGDVKLALLLGAALGKEVTLAVAVGLIATWPWIAVQFARHGKAARKATLPLGPALAIGTAIVGLLSDRAL